jgi:hypothetical protein
MASNETNEDGSKTIRFGVSSAGKTLDRLNGYNVGIRWNYYTLANAGLMRVKSV